MDSNLDAQRVAVNDVRSLHCMREFRVHASHRSSTRHFAHAVGSRLVTEPTTQCNGNTVTRVTIAHAM